MADLVPDVGAIIRDKDGNIIPDATSPVARPKHAPTRSETQDDQSLGLETGGYKQAASALARFLDAHPNGISQEVIGKEAKRLRDIETEQQAKEMFANFGGQIAGSAVTPIVGEIGGAIGGKISGAAAKPTAIGINALSAFVKKPSNAELAKQVIAGAGKKLATMALGDRGAEAAGEIASRVSSAAPETLAAAGRAAGAAATAAAPPAFGALSNNIERLRASAAGNPRAAELLAKITEYQPNFDTVTQGTLGGQP